MHDANELSKQNLVEAVSSAPKMFLRLQHHLNFDRNAEPRDLMVNAYDVFYLSGDRLKISRWSSTVEFLLTAKSSEHVSRVLLELE